MSFPFSFLFSVWSMRNEHIESDNEYRNRKLRVKVWCVELTRFVIIIIILCIIFFIYKKVYY